MNTKASSFSIEIRLVFLKISDKNIDKFDFKIR